MKNRTSLTNDEKYILTEREINSLQICLKDCQDWCHGRKDPYVHFSYILGELEEIKTNIRAAEDVSDLESYIDDFYGHINQEKQNLKALKKYLIHLYSKKYMSDYYYKVNRHTPEKNIETLKYVLDQIETKQRLLAQMPHSKIGVWRHKWLISRLDSPSFIFGLTGEDIVDGIKAGLETNV